MPALQTPEGFRVLTAAALLLGLVSPPSPESALVAALRHYCWHHWGFPVSVLSERGLQLASCSATRTHQHARLHGAQFCEHVPPFATLKCRGIGLPAELGVGGGESGGPVALQALVWTGRRCRQ